MSYYHFGKKLSFLFRIKSAIGIYGISFIGILCTKLLSWVPSEGTAMSYKTELNELNLIFKKVRQLLSLFHKIELIFDHLLLNLSISLQTSGFFSQINCCDFN